MKKSEFMEYLSAVHGIDKKLIERAVGQILHTISKSLIRGDRVELRGLGTFGKKEMLPRKAHNPKTGEIVNVGLKYKAFFKASKKLREKINQ